MSKAFQDAGVIETVIDMLGMTDSPINAVSCTLLLANMVGDQESMTDIFTEQRLALIKGVIRASVIDHSFSDRTWSPKGACQVQLQ